jgi:hypothetical protein
MRDKDAHARAPLVRALRKLPVAARVDPLPGGAAIELGGHVYRFAVHWAGSGYPNEVLRTIDGIAPPPSTSPPATSTPDATAVVTARRISPGAQRILDARGISWADEEGAARITAAPALLVSTVARSWDQTPRPGSGMRWSPSAASVAELILDQHARTATGSGEPTALPPGAVLAAQLPFSAAQVSKVLVRFDERGWTRKDGPQRGPSATRTLADPSGLLDSWARWYDRRVPRQALLHATYADSQDFVAEHLAPALAPDWWCVSGWLGLAHLAPFATATPTILCHVSEETWDLRLEEVFAQARLRRVEEGARVVLVRADAHLRQLIRPGSPPLAPDLRVYGDLRREGPRGREAAEHLREFHLGF